MATTKKYRYFLYSNTQYNERMSIEKSMGKKYVPGKVFYKGKWRQFTQMSTVPSNARYADARLVAEGNLEDLNYKKSTTEWGN